MSKTKELNIKHQKYYFLDDMIDIKNFQSNLLKVDKKSHKDTDVYYIGYITIKKFGDCKNIHSVNPLYLIIRSASGYFKEENGEKYLILDSTEEYKKVFSEIKSKSETINYGKEMFYEELFYEEKEEEDYSRIRVNTDDDIPLNKPLKFPTLTIIIRWVFQNGKINLYPQIYLDECLYESQRCFRNLALL